jgi:hypothetical protein
MAREEEGDMKQHCNPVRKIGERNAFCPYYSECLDYVIERCWEGWDCSDCSHKMTEEPRNDVSLCSNDSVDFYDLPPGLCREFPS